MTHKTFSEDEHYIPVTHMTHITYFFWGTFVDSWVFQIQDPLILYRKSVFYSEHRELYSNMGMQHTVGSA
jgi:hypothetical protein